MSPDSTRQDAPRRFRALAPDAGQDGAPEHFLLAVGARLRTLRARRGMTRRLLAAQSGVSERYIAQMEAGTGNGSILLLRAIADALHVRLHALLEDEEEKPPLVARLERMLAHLSPSQAEELLHVLDEHLQTHTGAERARRIALIGLRGAGKSSLGRLLAQRLGAPFFELDREIEREAGMDLREIFELHGQPGFRRLEHTVLERLVGEAPEAVIATGGSIVAERATFDLLLATCRTVWVKTSPEEHMQRVIDQGDLRPMHENRQAMADLQAILASRDLLYRRADLILDTSGKTLNESLLELLHMTATATHPS